MRSHLKVYFDFETEAGELTDDEKGRLLLAMLRYAKDGSEGTLTGNERFLFPVFRAKIERDIETYATKVSNGRKGGRPVITEKPEETENNRNKPEETEKKESSRFKPPTIDEVRQYCSQRNKGVNPDKWFNYYQSNGWKVGKNPMKNWQAAVRTWEESNNANNGRNNTEPKGKIQSEYSWLDSESAV